MIDLETFLTHIKNGEIPPAPPVSSSILGYDSYDLDSFDSPRNYRHEVTTRGMWAIVDKIWTRQLADYIGDRACLEVMAGYGWLAKALTEHGVDVVVTDNGDWNERHSNIVSPVYDVEQLDGINAVKKYKDRDVLIVSWPPYEGNAICRICEMWPHPKEIVYIGEEQGGCNAPDEFFDNFQVKEDVPEFSFMSWNGLHDRILIGTYHPKQEGK